MVELFDAHAHLDEECFDADRDEVISRALQQGVTGIINVGACMASSARSIALAGKYPGIFAAVGIHPHDAKEASEEDFLQLAKWTAEPKVVAVGEIGLDYFYDLSPHDVQKEVFIRQINVARQCGKPVIIHDRDAHGDVMEILRQHGKGVTGVMHCFSGSREMARELLGLGFYISFAGPVTFKKSVKLKEVAKEIPLDRLLVETDSPYLTPEPFRGKRNESGHVKLVAQEIANLREITFGEITEATSANVHKLFGI
jgi:TatD DNase family protein